MMTRSPRGLRGRTTPGGADLSGYLATSRRRDRHLRQQARDAEQAVVLIGVERPDPEIEDGEIDCLAADLQADQRSGNEEAG